MTTSKTGNGILMLSGIALFGFLIHFLRPMVKKLGPAWTELTSYTIGALCVMSTLPATMWWLMELAGNSDDECKQDTVAVGFLGLLLSNFAFGLGVALGWLVQPDDRPSR